MRIILLPTGSKLSVGKSHSLKVILLSPPRCCPNFGCSAGFQPAQGRQDGGATSKLG